MTNDQVAIAVKDLKKSFKLPHEQHSGLKQLVVNIAKGKKGYEVQQVLDDMSFEIKKGEFFGIVGRNGSGKSTLLKLLAGIYTPDSGIVQVNGSLTPFIELGVGFNPELTGRENVFLNGALLGFGRKEMEAMYDDIVSFAELERFMDQKLKNYSSGMQVRLAFSIAVRAQSDILILDEVLAVGDEAFQRKCLLYFKELKNKKQTVVLVTHDMTSVERFCDRVLVVDQGKQIGVFSTNEAQAIYKQLNFDKTSTNSVYSTKKQWGSKEHIVETIWVNGSKNGDDPIRVKKGDKLSIRLAIAAKNKQDTSKVVLGLGFYDEDAVYIAGPNSQKYSFATNSTLFYEVNNLPLNPGTYHLEVALMSEDTLTEYYHMTNAVIIEVYDSTTENYGKVDMMGAWGEEDD